MSEHSPTGSMPIALHPVVAIESCSRLSGVVTALIVAIALFISGCVSSRTGSPLLERLSPEPLVPSAPPLRESLPQIPPQIVLSPIPSVPIRMSDVPIPTAKPALPPPPSYPDARTGRAMVTRLLPESVRDRSGWATDIFVALAALNLTPTTENSCAAIALIEQESLFQADPVVLGLPAIVKNEIERQRKRYGLPQWFVQSALSVNSPTGRTYARRIATLRTERDLNKLYEDMVSELPMGRRLFADYNPVRTGGPMQVSVAFARSHVASSPYPYAYSGSLRDEVFSRRGGLYFGIAYLLDYPATYTEPLYRFADFNAGRYSSRNAAFQVAVSTITGIRLSLDGDVLRYQDGVPAAELSQTQRAVETLSARLGMTRTEISRDLQREKTSDFERTRLYARVFALAEQVTPGSVPRARVPRIELKSPKIKRRLTTEWFARRVEWRYRQCLARNA